jgi:four helix bundle protein
MTPEELNERLLEYAARILRLTTELLRSFASKHIGEQLLRSGTSIGANYEEAQGGESKADFVHKLQIALKESREAHYWLRLLAKAAVGPQASLQGLIKESIQIRAILSKAVATAKSRS